jgi:hypothetical protein
VLVPVLVAAAFGDPDGDGVGAWVYTAMDTVFVFGPVMLAGIGLRKVASAIRRRHPGQPARSH